MLVLSRRNGERIVIDGRITVTVIGVRGRQVRLGIAAPAEVRVWREEVRAEREPAAVQPDRNLPAGPQPICRCRDADGPAVTAGSV
jgi:carbon storage regulator